MERYFDVIGTAALILLVTLRILALPVPEVSAHGLQVLSGLEPELLLSKGRVSREIGNISATEIKVQGLLLV